MMTWALQWDSSPHLVLFGSEVYVDNVQTQYYRSTDPEGVLRQYLRHIMQLDRPARGPAIRVTIWLVRHFGHQPLTASLLTQFAPTAAYSHKRGSYRLVTGEDVLH